MRAGNDWRADLNGEIEFGPPLSPFGDNTKKPALGRLLFSCQVAEMRVRFPSPAPFIIKHLRSSASKLDLFGFRSQQCND
jgi:hypothetical protein